MITVDQALEPLYTLARECEYKLTYVYTNCDYREDPLLNKPETQFELDSAFTVAELQLGPAAHIKKD